MIKHHYAARRPARPDAEAIATATIDLMARVMNDLSAGGTVVDDYHVQLYGDFTSGEMKEHWRAAADRARELRRRNELERQFA
jgi:hypothetical protein